MIKIYKILIAILTLVSLKSNAQFNTETNSFGFPEKLSVVAHQPDSNAVSHAMSGIPCNPNSFFTTNGTNIEEYELNGNTITHTGTILPFSYQYDLAYCSNLNGGSFNPTFYSSNSTNPKYFDSTNWITTSSNTFQSIHNPGGHSNFLYFCAGPPAKKGKQIVQYDGTSLNLVYTTPSSKDLLSDLVVDDNNNLWFITASDTLSFISDSIYVLSTNGQIIKRFYFSYNLYNSYGAFLLNGKLYIGLGSVNPISPYSLLPITFLNNSAILGPPINFLASYGLLDLASCNPGLPLLVNEITYENTYELFPNPTSSLIEITSNEFGSHEYKIFNINGVRMGESIITNDRITSFDVHLLPSGIYYVECQNGKTIIRKKFIKV